MSESEALDRVVPDAENPWLGLHEFDERGKDFFNGRDQETIDLVRLVIDAPLTVLFGASGLGKTSLLLAGLAPALRQQNLLPVYVRLDPRDRSAPLVEQAATAIRAELTGHHVDHPPWPSGESLWEYLHRAEFELWSESNHLLTPVFIFDQFEEVFTLGSDNRQGVERLREDLADLIENRVPQEVAKRFENPIADAPVLELPARRFKVVLSFREDFLPEVEGWRGAIPSLVRNRFRLLPMNGKQALAAVTKTGGRLVDPAIGQKIVAFAAAAETGRESRPPETAPTDATREGEPDDVAELTIEPALLSLVCTGLNERRKAAHKATIDQALLSTTGQAIVTEFYERCVRDLPERGRRFIEEKLITESGFRNPFPREDAIAQGYLSESQLEALVKGRLLRVERHLGTDRIELIHDLLTKVVRAFRDQERARTLESERVERERVAKRRTRFVVLGAGLGGTLALLLASVFFYLWTSEKAALERYQQGEQARRQAELRQNEAEAHRRESEEKLSKEEALNEETRAVEGADKIRADALTAASRQQYDRAIALFAQALSIYQRYPNASRVVRAEVERGRIYALTGKQDLAKQDIEQACDTAKQMQSPGDEALCLESKASLHEQLGEPDTAALYQQAQDGYRFAGDSLSVARIYEWKAAQNEVRRQFEPATDAYKHALERYRIAGDSIGVARIEEAISRTVPWGYLVDLKRSAAFPMRGDRVTVGRNVEGIQNDISFGDTNYVLRRHLVIGREGFQTDDLRSLNGTTVNAQQLAYGLGTKLSGGDVISLANEEILQFTTQAPTLPSIPPSTWAIFIDGSARSYVYLTESAYSVVLTSGDLQVEKGDAASAVLKIRHGQQGSEFLQTVRKLGLAGFTNSRRHIRIGHGAHFRLRTRPTSASARSGGRLRRL